MPVIYDQQTPSPAEAARSATLCKHIQQIIQAQGGAISFAEYMAMALYHPELGYYNNPTFTLGPKGDFTTAPEISPLFAQCLASHFLPVLQQMGHEYILELGAGTGRFAGDLLHTLKSRNQLPQQYYIYEPNLGLRQQQIHYLSTHYPGVSTLVTWLDQLPENFHGVIFANEVLDALPASCFGFDHNGLYEKQVVESGEGFIWKKIVPASDSLNRMIATIQQSVQFAAGYQSDVNLNTPTLISSLASCLTSGIITFADYGYGRSEYYHPARTMGTLTCFYQHQKNDDPFRHPGLQDITTHVDFTLVAETALMHHCELVGYTTQAGFLLDCGLVDLVRQADENLSEAAQFELHQSIKTLTLPSEMGEVIKFMTLQKNSDIPVPGFTLQDRRHQL